MSSKQGKVTSTLVAGSDLILDAAITGAEQDRLNHEAIAKVVADLTMHAATPVNIAVFGAWGSGKSSFFGLLEQRIKGTDPKVKVARYDAWKYGGRALKKHFVGSVADQIGLGGKEFEDGLAHDQESLRLDLWDWVKTNKKSLGVGLGAAIVIAVIWFLLVGLAALAVNHNGIGPAARVALASVGTALSLSFAALLVGPKVLESAVVKVKEAAPETDDEFAKSFEKMVAKGVKVDSGERLVVFIDELDRCSPEDVVATLIDLKTFLDATGCVFVVAADREVLERALREVPQANPVRNEDPYYSTPGAFLDKIFQHQIPLPPLRPQALTRFARGQVETQGGLWAELRAAQADDRLFLRVVYGLVPVHVRSPRRVKVLLNNYATNVRIAQARGVDWLARAEELAALTVLETEFPAVAADLVRFPTLLKYLRDKEQTPRSPSDQATVASYRRLLSDPGKEDANQSEGTPVAGDLLVDGKGDSRAGRQANKTLVENLLAYLRKIDASGIADPRPDLLFLQSAGAQEGIDDPDLAEAIDLAADNSATDVVDKFADQPSATIATAVRLLAQQADIERGPGRLAILEAVCRLTERLDPVDAQAVAPIVAGSVLAEANNPDWPTNATPGALILGVIGASKPLVETLLKRQDAEAMAEAGLLERISAVLAYANAEQSKLVYDLLGSAYYLHPEPLHTALASTPPSVAEALWNNTSATVKAALKMMATPPPTPATATAATRTAATTPVAEEPSPDDTAAERFEALLAAVESRTDDQAGSLISTVLLFGQEADQPEVRTAASDRTEEAISRINDPVARNKHAMAGLYHSPLSEAEWWADLLDEHEPAPDGYVVFEHLLDALATSNESDTGHITAALPSVIPHIPDDELSTSEHWVGVTLGKTVWSTATAPTARNRAAIYAMAEALRPRLNATDATNLDATLAADLVAGLDDVTHIDELLALIRNIRSSVAVQVENLAAERTTDDSDIVPTLRVRIACAARGSNATITADDILAADDIEGEKEVFAEWLALTPPLPEAQKVFGKITIYNNALDRYAAALDISDRTALWVDLADRNTQSGNWSQTAFEAIGKHGIASPAVEQTAAAIAAATQQAQRDALIDRLTAAKLVEQPPHRAATDLILQLLGTPIGGDDALAARVALKSRTVAYGKTTQVREAFDAAVTARPNALTKAQQENLRNINLLSKPPKKRGKGLRGLLGG